MYLLAKVQMETIAKTKPNFYKIDSNIQKDLSVLLNITNKTKNLFLESLFPKEITNYLFYFLSEDFFKNKIEFDSFCYYLVVQNNETIGFFSCKNQNNTLYIADIFLTKEYQNKGIGKNIIEFLKNKAQTLNIKTIQTAIYQNDSKSRTFFEKMAFKKRSAQAKYLGSDIYLFEDIFELTN